MLEAMTREIIAAMVDRERGGGVSCSVRRASVCSRFHGNGVRDERGVETKARWGLFRVAQRGGVFEVLGHLDTWTVIW